MTKHRTIASATYERPFWTTEKENVSLGAQLQVGMSPHPAPLE